jgi:hypothetical protein
MSARRLEKQEVSRRRSGRDSRANKKQIAIQASLLSRRCERFFRCSLALVIACFAATADIHAQTAIPPHLPDLFVFNYQPSNRDPFISPDAQRRLVKSGSTTISAGGAQAVQNCLDIIIKTIQDELFVEGVSTGDQQTQASALINGVTFHPGDKIPVPVKAETKRNLEELVYTYGLPQQSSETRSNIFVLVVSIQTTGVTLALPGFKGSLCRLKYWGDAVPEQIHLERKPTAAAND